MTDPVLEKLDELVRVTREASLGDRYLDAAGVAAFLGYSENYVANKIANLPDFPAPLRLGHPRWLKSDVARWAHARKEKKR